MIVAYDSVMGGSSEMYALDTISLPGILEEIHGWSQSHYVDFNVKHHMTVSNPSIILSKITCSSVFYM